MGNNPINYRDPTGAFVWFLPVATGAVGAITSGAGYIIGNVITGDSFNLKDFGIAAGVGAAAGAAAPYTALTLPSAMATGAVANVIQGWATTSTGSSPEYSGTQAVSDALIGAVGGVIGGAFTRNIGYGKIGTALPDMVESSNAHRDISSNVTAQNLSRNTLGSIATTVGGSSPLANVSGK